MSASHVVRSWTRYQVDRLRREPDRAYVDEPFDAPQPTAWHVLETPATDRSLNHPVSVSFGVGIPGHPDVVCVRSSNWRCEHEPHGWMRVDAARAFYRECVRSGMRPRPAVVP